MNENKAAKIIDSIPEYFSAELLLEKERSFTIVYKLLAESGIIYKTVTVKNSHIDVKDGTSEKHDLLLIVKPEIYLRIVYGKMDYELARWCGHIRFIGNNLLQKEMNTYLNLPQDMAVV